MKDIREIIKDNFNIGKIRKKLFDKEGNWVEEGFKELISECKLLIKECIRLSNKVDELEKIEHNTSELHYRISVLRRENKKLRKQLEEKGEVPYIDIIRQYKKGGVNAEEVNRLKEEMNSLKCERDYYKVMYELLKASSSNSRCSSNIDFNSYYRKLAKHLHPDRNNGDDEGMKILNELKDKMSNK